MKLNANPIKQTPFCGKIIAVPETRQLDVFSQLLESRGAQVLRCPLIGIETTTNTAPVLRWINTLIQGEFDWLIFYTGEGVSRLLEIAGQSSELRLKIIEALTTSKIIVRGPKPAKALRELGIKAQISVDPATTEGLLKSLQSLELGGSRFGVQIYGETPPPDLIDFFQANSARYELCAPYCYTEVADDKAVLSLVDDIIEHKIDAIAFTSSPQIRRIFAVAEANQKTKLLSAALQTITVASVGPKVNDTLAECGVSVQVQPNSSFFLKPLTQALMGYWQDKS